MEYLNSLKQEWKGLFIAVGVGTAEVLIRNVTGMPILDPLFIAMVIGIAIRAVIKFPDSITEGFSRAPLLFIPPGVVLYGAVSLNFNKVAQIREINIIFLLLIVFIVYIISALLLATLFGVKEKVGYLIATGSSICGASAIAITSKSIDAEPDEVSVSLISVFVSALIGLFIIIPLSAAYFKISGLDYGVFSGSVLQFTGFVKASVLGLSPEVKSMALAIKALRYIGLLLAIPLFSSFVRGKLYVPWYLWAFLGAGILFSALPGLADTLRPVLKPVLKILWSIAMGSIGLNADIRKIFTKDGLKSFGVSLLSFVIASAVFLGGIKLIG